METKHTKLMNKIKEEFIKKDFFVETEKILPFGKGAVDIVAYKKNLKIYIEIKSNPNSINSKKVNSQLNRYKSFFGNEGIYCLISPGFDDAPRICSLDRRINSSLDSFFNDNP